MSERWGDSQRDRDALDAWITREGPEEPWDEVDVPDQVEVGDRVRDLGTHLEPPVTSAPGIVARTWVMPDGRQGVRVEFNAASYDLTAERLQVEP
jgi:hypothetical protein